MLSKMRLCVPAPKMESSRPSSSRFADNGVVVFEERSEVLSPPPIRFDEREFEESGAGAFRRSRSSCFLKRFGGL